ncbi:MAG: alpha/beta hydrolase [Alphaproteobacteria bacterium]|nr:alpha/beta hydrolase [Alphaproteobacteria bacterium]
MAEIWSSEYWAKKGPVDLYMWRKRVGAPKPGEAPLPLLFLVHGSSLCARTGFDLPVPGKPDYSMMDWFAVRGFDVWTMDHENYGRSTRTSGNSDIASGVADLRAAFPVVIRETGQKVAHFYGSSSGALRASAFANACPEYVASLVLDAFTWTGKDSPTLVKRAERLEEYRASNVRKVDRAFFHSIFNRDKPGLAEDGVADIFADFEMQFGDTVPTGTYVDMCANLPVVDPAKIRCATMISRGEHDGIATLSDLLAFYEALPENIDKQFIILPGQAHVGTLGTNRTRAWHMINAFLTMPARRDFMIGERQAAE